MFPEQNLDSTDCDSAELCIKRLSRKLSEVEIVMATQEGRANQMKKERNAGRAENEQLKKEIMKLKSELLRERMNSALIENEIKKLEAETAADEKLEDSGEIEDDLLQRRRVSLPVSSMSKEIGRRSYQLHSKDMKKLLDKRSNELLQQRQKYRIFENRFMKEAERCSKLDRNLERMNRLLVDLLRLHSEYHAYGSSEFKCSSILMIGKRMTYRYMTLFILGFTTVLVVSFVFLVMGGYFKR